MANDIDARVARLGRRINRIYAQAQKELTEKVDSFFANFERLDKQKLALVKAGKLSEDEYKRWRKNKLLMGENYKNLRDNVGKTMLEANKTAAAYINREMIPTYMTGFNIEGENVSKQVKGYSFDLIDEDAVKRLTTSNKTILPYKIVDGRRDVRWNTKHVNSAILQGIIQGESIPKIAKRLEDIAGMNKDSAKRNARTAITGAHNAGRQDCMNKLAQDGVILQKEWFATTGDSRTRDAHLELHHVVVDYDKPFENSIGRIMFPGDPNAHPANVYNCRCSMATVVKGFKKPEEVPEEEEEEQAEENADLAYSVSGLKEPKRPSRSDFDNEDDFHAAREKYRAEKEEFNRQMDEAIQKAVSVKRFETKEDFIAWAKDNDILLLDDVADRIDLRVMNEASTTIEEMFRRFPDVKSFDYLDYDGSMYHSQFALMADPDGYMEWRGGIAFGEKRFDNYEKAVRDAFYGMTSGENVMGDGTFSTLIRHEYGHGVESYIRIHVLGKDGIMGLDDWRGHFPSLEAYRSAVNECVELSKKYDADLRSLFRVGMEGQSEYACQDLRELFAEGFAEWSSGGKTEFAKAFGEFLGRWYK